MKYQGPPFVLSVKAKIKVSKCPSGIFYEYFSKQNVKGNGKVSIKKNDPLHPYKDNKIEPKQSLRNSDFQQTVPQGQLLLF